MSADPAIMFYVGFCRICGTGPLGIRQCGACDQLAIVCDECDAVWDSADLSASPLLSDDPNLPCSACGASLLGGDSHWATLEEIRQSEWLQAAIDSGELELQSGKPFAAQPEIEDVDQLNDLPNDAGG